MLSKKLNTLEKYIYEKRILPDEEVYADEDTIKAKRRVGYLTKFLNLSQSELKYPDTILYILADIVYDYYEDPPIFPSLEEKREKEKHKKDIKTFNEEWTLFDRISNYTNNTDKDKQRRRNYIYNKEFDIHDIYVFFQFFFDNCYWTEKDRYSSAEECLDTLEYLNKYAYVFSLWQTSRVEDGYPNNIFDDIKQFALALYDRKKLPDELDYTDYANGLREAIGPEPLPYDIEAEKERLGLQ